MSNNVIENKSFQEKMFEKIRDSMGDLMSDEDLKKLVDQAMKKAFFEKTIVKDGYRDVEKEPYFISLIRAHMQVEVQNACTNYLENNKDVVKKQIDDSIAKGFYGLMQQHIDNKISQHLYNFGEQIKQGLL